MKAQNQVVHETDWIGSNLVYYNEDSGEVHPNINHVFQIQNAELDKGGFINYLKYGFSVFGDTPIKGVKFTLPNTQLIHNVNGKLELRQLPDPVLKLVGSTMHESDALAKIEEWVLAYHESANQKKNKVLLPISSGLDSRLLAYFSRNFSSVETFSYGISLQQQKSSEVLIAKKVTQALNLNWTPIQLGNFHNFLELNNEVYGPSVHAHSMYHFEFYSKIKSLLGEGVKAEVLSGIYGDVWAGSWKFDPILKASDVKNLAVTHKVEASERLIKDTHLVTEKENIFFNNFREELKDPIFRIVSAARIKMILIRHLIETPKSLGFDVRSPFLDLDIAVGMLTIDPKRRANRAWQKEFLDAKIPQVNDNPKRFLDFNVSDLNGAQKVKLPILSVSGNTPVALCSYDLKKISANVQVSRTRLFAEVLLRATGISGILSRIGINHSSFEESYADYVILYPLISIFGKVKNRKSIYTVPTKS